MKNIGSESQNDLTVNEKQLKMKQFPFNIVHFTTFKHCTRHFLQQEKLKFYYCKTKQFLLQQVFHKSHQEKSPSLSNSPILIQKAKTFGLPPNDPWASPTFHLPQLSHIQCLYNLQYITFKQTNKALKWRAPLDCSGTSSMLRLLMQCS